MKHKDPEQNLILRPFFSCESRHSKLSMVPVDNLMVFKSEPAHQVIFQFISPKFIYQFISPKFIFQFISPKLKK